MKCNGFYFWMFKSPMKAVLTEKYGNAYAGETMKKSKKVLNILLLRFLVPMVQSNLYVMRSWYW